MNSIVKFIVAAFVIVGVIFVSYQVIGKWHRQELATALKTQRDKNHQKVTQLESQLAALQSTLDEIKKKEIESRPEPPTKEIKDIFGQDSKVEVLGNEDTDCATHFEQAKALFAYFDKQGYLDDEKFDTQFLPFLQESMKLLAEKPPVIVAEMDDLILLAKNVSHLYRTLGISRLRVYRNIIEQESDILEPAMAVLYGWITACRGGLAPSQQLPELKTFYEYGSFFLNTLGGRSYLLRRDSKLRILVNYYSVLTLDLANDEKLNSAGLDIRPHIDFLITDLSNQTALIYRDRYLEELNRLKSKYESS